MDTRSIATIRGACIQISLATGMPLCAWDLIMMDCLRWWFLEQSQIYYVMDYVAFVYYNIETEQDGKYFADHNFQSIFAKETT